MRSVLVAVGHDLCQIVEIELDAFLQVVFVQKLLEFFSFRLSQGLPEVHQELPRLLDGHLISFFSI
jgi:hypothetical protein